MNLLLKLLTIQHLDHYLERNPNASLLKAIFQPFEILIIQGRYFLGQFERIQKRPKCSVS